MDFLAGLFLLIFVGRSAQKSPPGKSLAKSSPKFIQQESPTHFCRGAGPRFEDTKNRLFYREETKKWVCKRVVLAHVPLFRFWASRNIKITERKKHPKKICIKNFEGTLAGGSRRGLRRPNSLCRCWFSQQNTVHKEFRGGGGLRGSWGWGLRSNFGAPFLYVHVKFLGLDKNDSFSSVPGEHCRERFFAGKFRYRGTSAKPTFWKPPICEPPTLKISQTSKVP